MKNIIIAALMLVLSIMFTPAVFAQNEHTEVATQGKALVESQVSCDELDDAQLEAIGEYIMEGIHPGDQHEVMDDMMGGEGSDSLHQAHIFMARRFYCGEGDTVGMMGGNWNMMEPANTAGYGMMGEGGMMNWDNANNTNRQSSIGNYNTGMMGFPTFWHSGVNVTTVLLWILLLTGIAVCVKYLIKK